VIVLAPSSLAKMVVAALALMLVQGSKSPLADIGPAPDLVLTDAAGKRFSLADLRGKVVLVSFVYTTCTGTCPATTLHLTQVQKALEKNALWGKRVHFVSITLDPARDRAEVLAAYAKNYGIDQQSWHFLTGAPDQVLPVIRAWGMWVKTSSNGVLDHPSRLFLVDPNGRQREIYNLETLAPRVVVNDVQSLLDE
jgi:protein SCO1/2